MIMERQEQKYYNYLNENYINIIKMEKPSQEIKDGLTKILRNLI